MGRPTAPHPAYAHIPDVPHVTAVRTPMTAVRTWSTFVPQMRRILVGGEDPGRERVRASILAAARRLTAK
ncbi:hypothetical protein [Streptomyces sp. R41]|uniref:TetR family transcriptional regulator n=1 Tax=Streptomyces sp. R41 TaxID=3238632 RepID=A0AB39RF20_9ACTN